MFRFMQVAAMRYASVRGASSAGIRVEAAVGGLSSRTKPFADNGQIERAYLSAALRRQFAFCGLSTAALPPAFLRHLLAD
jgi:hypothetical protein